MVTVGPDTSQRTVVVGKKQETAIGLTTREKTLDVELAVVGTTLNIGVLEEVEGPQTLHAEAALSAVSTLTVSGDVFPATCTPVPDQAISGTSTLMSATQADLSDANDATAAEAHDGDSIYVRFDAPTGRGFGTKADSSVRLRMTANDNGTGGAGERRVEVVAYATADAGFDNDFYAQWIGSIPDNSLWYDDGLPVGPKVGTTLGSITTYPDSTAHWWAFQNHTSSDWDTDGTDNKDPYPAMSRLLSAGNLTIEIWRTGGSPAWTTSLVKLSEASMTVPCPAGPPMAYTEARLTASSDLATDGTVVSADSISGAHYTTSTDGNIGQWDWGRSSFSGSGAYVSLNGSSQPSITVVTTSYAVSRSDWAYGGAATGAPYDMMDIGSNHFLFVTSDAYVVLGGYNVTGPDGATSIFGEKRLVTGSHDINDIGFLAWDNSTLTLYVTYYSTVGIGGQTVKKTTWSWDTFTFSAFTDLGNFSGSPDQDWNGSRGGFVRDIRGFTPSPYRGIVKLGRGSGQSATYDIGAPTVFTGLATNPVSGGTIQYAYPVSATAWRSLYRNVVYGTVAGANKIEEWAYSGSAFSVVNSLTIDSYLPADTAPGTYSIQSTTDHTKYHLVIPYYDTSSYTTLGYVLLYDCFGEKHRVVRSLDSGYLSFQGIELLDLWWTANASTPAVMVRENTAADGSGTNHYGIDVWTHSP